MSFNSLKSELLELICDRISVQDLKLIHRVGNKEYGISAVLFDSVFATDDKQLALVVHESITKIAGITDIKYPYEEHKELFPQNSIDGATDWGKGLGVIRPHSDDIYEERDINAMSLTVCRDTSGTPTWFWLLKDVVQCLSNQELGELALSQATFYSGANVQGTCLQQTKPILRHHETEGITLRLDFRIDHNVGPRMSFAEDRLTTLFKKMRESFLHIRPLASTPATGSVGILSNFKILHGRRHLNPVMLYEGENSRILFRSKGVKEVYDV
jgi:hypothetical protein